jgi:hypothetical protein
MCHGTYAKWSEDHSKTEGNVVSWARWYWRSWGYTSLFQRPLHRQFFHVHHGHGNVFAAITPVHHHRLPWRGLTCRTQPKFPHAVAPESRGRSWRWRWAEIAPMSLQVWRVPDNLPWTARPRTTYAALSSPWCGQWWHCFCGPARLASAVALNLRQLWWLSLSC